jgi:hypothetical protein
MLPGSAVIGSSSGVAHPPLEEAGPFRAVAKGERSERSAPERRGNGTHHAAHRSSREQSVNDFSRTPSNSRVPSDYTHENQRSDALHRPTNQEVAKFESCRAHQPNFVWLVRPCRSSATSPSRFARRTVDESCRAYHKLHLINNLQAARVSESRQ